MAKNFSIKVSGLNKIKRQLDYMKSDKFIHEKLKEVIVEKVPEARLELGNFRFHKNVHGKIELDPTSVSAELYAKIAKVFFQ